ncbi:MAG: DUF4124 domain-containing protein [Xanthomonadales bacterium]|nr:DUF4124 domain-containing protein [Xanthomonadales bacterium]
MKVWKHIGVGTAAACLLLALGGPAQAQKLYKWVDKDGNVHYSDQVPPDQVDQARQELNEQGVVVDRLDRAKTDEELAAEAAALRVQLEQMAAMQRQATEDRKVLAQYAGEQDIIRIRDQRIETLDRQIQSAQAYISSQTQSLADLTKRAAELESQGVTISDAMTDSIKSIRDQIAKQESHIAEKEAEKQVIRDEYAVELARYREVAERQMASQKPR